MPFFLRDINIKDFLDFNLTIGRLINKDQFNREAMAASELITSLPLSPEVNNTFRILRRGAMFDDLNQACTNCLKILSNRFTLDGDAFPFELEPQAVFTAFLYADKKYELYNKLTTDEKMNFFRFIGDTYCNDDIRGIHTDHDTGESVSELVHTDRMDWFNEYMRVLGLIPSERQLEMKKFQDKYLCGPGKPPVFTFLNFELYPIISNIYANSNIREYSDKITYNEYFNSLESSIQTAAVGAVNSKLFPEITTELEAYNMLSSILALFRDTDQMVKEYNCNSLKSVTAGFFFTELLALLTNFEQLGYFESGNFIEAIKFIKMYAVQVFKDFNAAEGFTQWMINYTVDSILYSGKDFFKTEEVAKAMGIYLSSNDMYKLYKTMCADYDIYQYISNGETEILDEATPATEAKKEEPTEYDRARDSLKYHENEKRKKPNDQNADEDEDSEDDGEDEEEDEDQNVEVHASQSTKGYDKKSKRNSDVNRKVYKAFRKYNDNKEKVDSQLSKMIDAMKTKYKQNKAEEIINGKKFTPMGILKKALNTAAIFSFGKIAGIAYLVGGFALDKARTRKERNEILVQLENEIEMLDEKIDDARGDGNRQAKYALMRTKNELVRVRQKVKFGVGSTKDDVKHAAKFLNPRRTS